MEMNIDAHCEGKMTCAFKNDTRNMENFNQSIQKPQNWDWDSFIQSRKCMSLKFAWELCAMTMKNEAELEEKLTFCFKTDMRNFINFD